ncbi:MAG: hypothetical protein H6581_18910 [Bacteroidia bacterium]|nr:hypothetical protein [Bacteroidia bacterium]
MIYQAAIKLELENREVQVVIDFDTGLIGFTERVGEDVKEYFYRESPAAFKVAFLEKIKPLAVDRPMLNFRICRKNQAVMEWLKALPGGDKNEGNPEKGGESG